MAECGYCDQGWAWSGGFGCDDAWANEDDRQTNARGHSNNTSTVTRSDYPDCFSPCTHCDRGRRIATRLQDRAPAL